MRIDFLIFAFQRGGHEMNHEIHGANWNIVFVYKWLSLVADYNEITMEIKISIII